MDPSSKTPIDTSICPLCGEPNQCPMAADPDAQECWCSGKKFPRELLAQVPKGAVRRACICANCLSSYHRERKLPGPS